MTYLIQFQEKIKTLDYPGFIQLWEEYCFKEEVDVEELKEILIEAKDSDIAKQFGQHVTRALSLYEKIEDPEGKHEILKLIIDIQTRNDEDLANLIYNHLKQRYPSDTMFNEKIRLIGLRARSDFQKAISKYELLTHIKKGKFVFHTAGWGTGEVLDFSLLREELMLEFEYVIGHKNLSFENALKTLVPIKDDHFLSRRFGNPDLLEKQTKESPIDTIKLLLKDLGPKTAAEIKENICDLVIPEKEWNRWWQTARAKIKKDTKIETPKSLQKPFKLRKKEISHENILQKSLEKKLSPDKVIQMVHTFIRDFPETLKNDEFKNSLTSKLIDVLSYEHVTVAQKLQINFFLETLKAEKEVLNIQKIIEETTSFSELIRDIKIISFKKQTLKSIRKYKKDWEQIFLDTFFSVDQNMLRDYQLKELIKSKSDLLKEKINDLIEHPLIHPIAFLWYFQKIFSVEKSGLFFSDNEGKLKLFESFLVLLDFLQNKLEFKDLAKKMINMITEDKYLLIRDIMKISSLEQAKEFILLSTKCTLLDDHDIKIINSLAKVVHTKLSSNQEEEGPDDTIWITEDGFIKLKNKIEHLATKEMIDNAKEIEEARALGDLRENAEYKAALERRSRLQSDLKSLADQLSNVKILTKDIVMTDKASVGTVVDITDKKGKKQTFTILGPLEANVDKNILSFQSKLAKEIIGHAIGEKFSFNQKEYTIVDIRNYFD